MIARRNLNGVQLRLVKVHVVVLIVRIALVMLHSENDSVFYNQNKRHISIGEMES